LTSAVFSHDLLYLFWAPSLIAQGILCEWFDDVASLLAARRSAEWRASSADEVSFIDHKRVAYFVSEEREVVLNS
jgi:hypothetical protein